MAPTRVKRPVGEILLRWLVLNLSLGLLPLTFTLVALWIYGSDATFSSVIQHGAIVSAAFGLASGSVRRLLLSARSGRLQVLVTGASLVVMMVVVQLLTFLALAGTTSIIPNLNPDRVVVISVILYVSAALTGASTEVFVALQE